MVLPSPLDLLNKPLLEEAMRKGWSDGVRHFSEDVWMSSPSMIIPCSIGALRVPVSLPTSSWLSIGPTPCLRSPAPMPQSLSLADLRRKSLEHTRSGEMADQWEGAESWWSMEKRGEDEGKEGSEGYL